MDKEKALMALRTVARQNGVPLETVIREIEQTIRAAMESPDPAVQARWEQIPRSGEIPTAVEVVAYLAEQLTDSGDAK